MKKTSIFFLIMSVILIITGSVLRNNAIKDAEKQNIKLFTQELTKDKDLVQTVELSSVDTNKINIELKDVDINIIGGADRSYAEIYNLNAIEYSAYTNNRAFTIKSDIISSIIGRAEGGDISFNGVRDYVRFEKHNNVKKINIYVASNAAVKMFDLKINNGNVNIQNIDIECDYSVNIKNGNITVKNTASISLLSADIKNGNINAENVYVANSDINIENGDLTFSTPSYIIYNYNTECEAGDIKYNTETHKGKFVTENPETNGNFNAHIGVGNITISTIEQPAE